MAKGVTHFLKDLFRIEKKPRKGLYPWEWASMAYLVLTSAAMLFAWTDLANPQSMLQGRVRMLATTLLLWGVYRMVPCRATVFIRALAQMIMLSWWYPDTYELNRLLPNLDHVFAGLEQQLFGCQPALLFSQYMGGAVWSELFCMGYFLYYPMIGLTAIYYFGWRYKEFHRATFVILASFFIYYVVFILVPVVGPTFYYKAIGLKDATAGVFPAVGHYFNFHQDCLTMPGWDHGVFYNLVETAKQAGERPTAAFPSSHVGISTVCMLLVLHARNYKLLWVLAPIYVLLCCATVYIQAHYLVDAIAGFISAVVLYFCLMAATRQMKSYN